MSEPTPPATQGATGYGPETTTPPYSDRPVVVRGPESLGGLLLILAGIAAAISLVLDWLKDDDVSGWGLVRMAFDDLGDVFDGGLWQPLVIVLVKNRPLSSTPKSTADRNFWSVMAGFAATASAAAPVTWGAAIEVPLRFE